LLSGGDTSFEAAGPASTYDLTSSDSHIAPGGILTVNGNGLGAAENLTFDGSAETDGSFRFFGGLGVNTLVGGSQNDGFFFQGGAFSGNDLATMDRVDGGGGADNQIGLRGDYSAVTEVRAAMVENIQTIAVISSQDPRYGASGAPFSYNLRLHDDSVAAGRTLTINGAGLAATEQLIVSGFSGVAGSLRLFGGAGDDALVGGNGDDIFFGGLGVDSLSGPSGSDRYVYTEVAQTSIFASDTIRNFGSGDRVDLAAVDANSGLAGDQDFTFIGSAAFTGLAGQLRIYDPSSDPDDFAVEADVDGDGAADLLLYLIADPGFTPTADSFLGLA
jgi:Ca2+-binding RTX toxin-like protein